MDEQRRLRDTRAHSVVDLSVPTSMASSIAVIPELSNLWNGQTMFEQNNMKESDIFSRIALEIEALNSSHARKEFAQRNVNKLEAVKAQSDFNVNEEDRSECVELEDDLSDAVEENNGSELRLEVSSGRLAESCKVNWLVCKKYPECPICTIEIEKPVVQTVSDFKNHVVVNID